MRKLAIITGAVLLLAGGVFVAMAMNRAGNESGSAVSAPVSAEVAAAEKQFMEQMVSHHSDAIAMAQMSPEKAMSQAVKSMSTDIISAQQKEIEDMKVWYKRWYNEELPSMSDMPGMSEEGGNMMNQLRSATDYDLEFVKQMTVHHQNAIKMAQEILTKVEHQELKDLANNIISSQTSEIEQMKKLQAQFEQNPPGSPGRSTL